MHASLCFLSYNRPTSLVRAIDTAVKNAHWPVEVIVHDDGSHPSVQQTLVDMMHDEDLQVSSLILCPPGHNEGVGRAFNRCASVATGDWIVKLDQDLVFEPTWLHRAIDIMSFDHNVGAVGLFKYEHEPCDWRKMEIPGDHDFCGTRYHYVRDFVSSALVTHREVLRGMGEWPEHSDAFAEDVEWKHRLRAGGYELALPDEDLARNLGFGIGPSTVVPAEGQVTKINHGPVIFSV